MAALNAHGLVRCADGRVTFRYRDSGTGISTLRTVSGAHFLWLVLQHVLPKGLRRSRNFGQLHPNCKHRQRLALLRCPVGPPSSAPPFTSPALSERPKLQCHGCESAMVIVRRRIAAASSHGGPAEPPGTVREGHIH